MNRDQRRKTARVEQVREALQRQAAGVNDGLRAYTERQGAAIASTLEVWRASNVEPVARRVNVAVGLAVLAVVIALLGLVV